MSGGTDKFQSTASANYSSNEGIVPNDYLKKIGLKIKGKKTFKNKTKVAEYGFYIGYGRAEITIKKN